MNYLPLIMLGVLLNAAAQLLLKAGTNSIGQFEFSVANNFEGWTNGQQMVSVMVSNGMLSGTATNTNPTRENRNFHFPSAGITGVPAEQAIAVARQFADNADKTHGKSMVIIGAGAIGVAAIWLLAADHAREVCRALIDAGANLALGTDGSSLAALGASGDLDAVLARQIEILGQPGDRTLGLVGQVEHVEPAAVLEHDGVEVLGDLLLVALRIHQRDDRTLTQVERAVFRTAKRRNGDVRVGLDHGDDSGDRLDINLYSGACHDSSTDRQCHSGGNRTGGAGDGYR